MKVLFANPPWRVPTSRGKELFHVRAGCGFPFAFEHPDNEPPRGLPFPLYLAVAAAALEHEPGVELVVRDSIALFETERAMLHFIHSERPDVIVWEASTLAIESDIQLAKVLKQFYPNVKLVWVGQHVTGLCQETDEMADGIVDFFILHEYEIPLLRLVQALRDGTDLGCVPGLARRVGGWLKTNHQQEPVDMKRTLWPARHLFPTNKAPNVTGAYLDGFVTARPFVFMWATRGCTHRCPFCTEIALIEQRHRCRTPEDVCDEMEHVIAEWKARHVYFEDNCFNGNAAFVYSLCDEILRRGLHRRVTWSAMCSFMEPGVDERMISVMHQAGCTGIKFGIDSVDPMVLKELHRPLDTEKILRLTSHCNRLLIKTHASLCCGHFSDTMDTLQAAKAFLMKLTADTIQVTIVTPFPGMEFYNRLKAAGRLNSNRWQDFNGLRKSLVKFPGMASEFVEQYPATVERDWIRHKLLTDGRWWYRHMLYAARSFSTNPGLVWHRIKQVIKGIL